VIDEYRIHVTYLASEAEVTIPSRLCWPIVAKLSCEVSRRAEPWKCAEASRVRVCMGNHSQCAKAARTTGIVVDTTR